MADSLELPRPPQLLRMAGWNLAESFGLPVAAYAVSALYFGRDAGLWAMVAAIWLAAAIRKVVTASVPALVTISAAVLTVQTAAAIATHNLFVFLVHFPIVNLLLCVLFARTARGHSPLAARLAAEVIGVRPQAARQPQLHRFFQDATVLWAGIFLLLAVTLGALLATIPVSTYVLVWLVTTVALLTAGAGASVLWLRAVLRRCGIKVSFVPANGECGPGPTSPDGQDRQHTFGIRSLRRGAWHAGARPGSGKPGKAVHRAAP